MKVVKLVNRLQDGWWWKRNRASASEFNIIDLTTFSDLTQVPETLTYTANRATQTDSFYNIYDHCYKDYGAGYFSGDFEFWFDFRITVPAVTGGTAICPMVVADVSGFPSNGVYDIRAGHEIFLYATSSPTGGVINVYEYNLGVQKVGASPIATTDGVTYYCVFKRDESVGTYGTAYIYVYSDAERTSLIGSSSLALTEKFDFQWLWIMSGWGNPVTAFIMTSYGENFKERIL